jgi:hypothetical protein
MTKKETAMNKDVADWICSFPNGNAYKRAAGPNNIGQPDVTGCLYGIRLELEGKRGTKTPSKIQAKRLREWAATGAITGVYYSLREAQEIVRQGLLERGIALQEFGI